MRFASPVFVGEEIEVRLYGVDEDTYAFEADSLGVPVVLAGRAELRPD